MLSWWPLFCSVARVGGQCNPDVSGPEQKGLQIRILRRANGAAKEEDTKEYLVKYKFSSLSKVFAGFP
jgi:hypothetical protein